MLLEHNLRLDNKRLFHVPAMVDLSFNDIYGCKDSSGTFLHKYMEEQHRGALFDSIVIPRHLRTQYDVEDADWVSAVDIFAISTVSYIDLPILQFCWLICHDNGENCHKSNNSSDSGPSPSMHWTVP